MKIRFALCLAASIAAAPALAVDRALPSVPASSKMGAVSVPLPPAVVAKTAALTPAAPGATQAAPADAARPVLQTLGDSAASVKPDSDSGAQAQRQAYDNVGAGAPSVEVSAVAPQAEPASGLVNPAQAPSFERAGPPAPRPPRGPAERLYARLAELLALERAAPMTQAQLGETEGILKTLTSNEVAVSFRMQGKIERAAIELRKLLKANPAGRDVSGVVAAAEDLYKAYERLYDDWKFVGAWHVGAPLLAAMIAFQTSTGLAGAAAFITAGLAGLAGAHALARAYYAREKPSFFLIGTALILRLGGLAATAYGVGVLLRPLF